MGKVTIVIESSISTNELEKKIKTSILFNQFCNSDIALEDIFVVPSDEE